MVLEVVTGASGGIRFGPYQPNPRRAVGILLRCYTHFECHGRKYLQDLVLEPHSFPGVVALMARHSKGTRWSTDGEE